MNSPFPEPSNQEVDTLIFSLLDGEISPEAHERLQLLIKGNAAHRQRYRELVHLHSIMEERASGVINLTQEGHQSVVPLHMIRERQRKRIIHRSFIAAAAVVILSLVAMYFVTSHSQARMAKVSFSDYSAFRIQHPSGTSDDLDENTLVPGSTIEISQGTLKLDIATDVFSVIQAPALITIMDEANVVVHSGKAWFEVGPEAIGFKVLTPQLEIIDLGTEFGVTADPTTAQEAVHVFKGKVRVTTRHKFKRTEALTAGESRAVRISGRLKKITNDESLFLKSLPSSLPSLSWNFDNLQHGGFDVKQIAIPGQLVSKVTQGNIVHIAGKEGKAINFTHSSGFIKTNWQGIDADRPRTIVCWIKCPMKQPKGAIIEWGIPLISSAKWRIGLNPEIQSEGGVKGALRTEFGNGNIIGSTDLRDGRWHQIISIYDGSGTGNANSIQLYVDGKKELISACLENEISTILDRPESEPVMIGRDFHGSIDSLRVYQGVMPPEAFADELHR